MTTLQDLGRPALRAAGFPTGGAMDPLAARVANILVGNDDTAALLECALVGPRLKFQSPATVAITGARAQGAEYATAFQLAPGQMLDLSTLTHGAYAYLAISGGGVLVPQVLSSRATDLRLKFGGLAGRSLRAGDELPTGQATSPNTPPADLASWYATHPPMRIIDGPEASLVSPARLAQPFTISPKSDRTGLRLAGPKLESTPRPDAPSAPVFPGTIQLPGDGHPIVLMADAQTLGGYPRIAHVISVDLPRLAQLRPGQPVHFTRVTLDQAHHLARQRERELGFLRYAISRIIRPNARD